MIELKSTRHEFEVRDESGYRFLVVAEYDPETGWSASTTVSTFGRTHASAAVAGLREPLRHLLQMLDEEPPSLAP